MQSYPVVGTELLILESECGVGHLSKYKFLIYDCTCHCCWPEDNHARNSITDRMSYLFGGLFHSYDFVV